MAVRSAMHHAGAAALKHLLTCLKKGDVEIGAVIRKARKTPLPRPLHFEAAKTPRNCSTGTHSAWPGFSIALPPINILQPFRRKIVPAGEKCF
jgi:hypothetical protein